MTQGFSEQDRRAAKAAVAGVEGALGVIGEVLSAVASENAAIAAPQPYMGAGDPLSINNYVCEAFAEVVRDYERREHPGEDELRQVAEYAGVFLAALDRVATLDLDAHARNILVLDNCDEMMDWLKSSHYYVKKPEDGSWQRKMYQRSIVPEPDRRVLDGSFGDKDWRDIDWSRRADADREFLRSEYLNLHPETQQRGNELDARIAVVESELAELKDEKKSKGFFNFSAKREVKERMAPVKDQLSDLRAQRREIDEMADNHIDAQVRALASEGWKRLDL